LFVVWAPFADKVSVVMDEAVHQMNRDDLGYWSVMCEDVPVGATYCFRLNDTVDRPDPASHFQPYGVHRPSQVVDHGGFCWEDDAWAGVPLREMVMYELHVGTFTPQGTFVAAIERLDDLLDLGINAIEIMPVAQFPGWRSWGYDGTYLFAVQNSYGSPQDFKRLVSECHKRGMSVILDVVYNHLGPEGNYLSDFGPYFTDRYRTPWGMAINFDGPHSNDVRNFFIENALHWFEKYHIDALRVDAVHGIFDQSARPFVRELVERVDRFSSDRGHKRYLIAESDLNDVRLVTPIKEGGIGFDAQWSDDFHHALHTILTGERQGYYADFGTISDMVTALKDGFVYQGKYSNYRKRNHGSPADNITGDKMVVFCQNHDQTGNRMMGERLASMVSFEALKLSAGVLLTCPYLPLLFMGEEYGEEAPFLYFADHSDQGVIEAVRKGRKEEFKEFLWEQEPPDPYGVDTFMSSKIQWEKRYRGRGKALCSYFQRLIALRKGVKCLSAGDKGRMQVYGSEPDKVVVAYRPGDGGSAVLIANFDDAEKRVSIPLPDGKWRKVLDSTDAQWGGPGPTLPERFGGMATELPLRGYAFALFLSEA
jgi:maltooligosyltrehalose trehalohydrolase